VYFYKDEESVSKFRIMKTPRQRKPLRGVARLQEKMIIYGLRSFAVKKRRTKDLSSRRSNCDGSKGS
jgi:hypothetical protein